MLCYLSVCWINSFDFRREILDEDVNSKVTAASVGMGKDASAEFRVRREQPRMEHWGKAIFKIQVEEVEPELEATENMVRKCEVCAYHGQWDKMFLEEGMNGQ